MKGYGRLNREYAGHLPALYANGMTIAEAWQNAMFALDKHGRKTFTSYDNPGDPQGIDACVEITVDNPLGEPKIHRCGVPTGIEETESYRLEVVYGVHDHWIDRLSEGTSKWCYTYHERLRAYDDGRAVIL